jgi:large repetitive protein
VVAPKPDLAMAVGIVPRARVGSRYSLALGARGGEGPYRWKRVAGALPRGLSLASSGMLAGVPAASGRFSVRVRVTDDVGSFVERQLTISVAR